MSIITAWSQEIKEIKLSWILLWFYFGLIRAQMRDHCLILIKLAHTLAGHCPTQNWLHWLFGRNLRLKRIFVLWVWLTGFGGLNGARRAIGLEDSNKDHRMGPKNLPRQTLGPKTGQSVPTAQVSVAPVRMEIPSLVCTVHCKRLPTQQYTKTSVADRIKALLLGNTSVRLWENSTVSVSTALNW